MVGSPSPTPGYRDAVMRGGRGRREEGEGGRGEGGGGKRGRGRRQEGRGREKWRNVGRGAPELKFQKPSLRK